MCGRFTLKNPDPLLYDVFDLAEAPQITARYNIAPTQTVPAIRGPDVVQPRQIELLRWGLIPSWAKDKSIGNRMINARSETADSKPSFRSAFRRRRCLVLADGFYEWQRVPHCFSGGGQRVAGRKQKQPFYITMVDRRPFAFAGLWERWQSREDEEVIESCTILTTEANELVADLHDRMPVILPPDAYEDWLNAEVQDVAALKQLLVPYPAREMDAYPVSTTVNSPRNESPACTEPLPG